MRNALAAVAGFVLFAALWLSPSVAAQQAQPPDRGVQVGVPAGTRAPLPNPSAVADGMRGRRSRRRVIRKVVCCCRERRPQIKACGCPGRSSPIRSDRRRNCRSSRGRARSLPIGARTSSSRTRAASRRALRACSSRRTASRSPSSPELKRVYIFDIGGPHTFRTIYLDGRAHPKNVTPDLLRPLDRPVGRRHARRRHRRLQRELLARSRRPAEHRAAAHGRAHHAHEPDHAALRADRRRSGRLHAALERDSWTWSGKTTPSCSSTSARSRTTRTS